MDWWQGSRAATLSQCWIGSGNFTAVATARDAHIPAGEFSSQTQLLTASAAGGKLAGGWEWRCSGPGFWLQINLGCHKQVLNIASSL